MKTTNNSNGIKWEKQCCSNCKHYNKTEYKCIKRGPTYRTGDNWCADWDIKYKYGKN